MGKDNKTKQVNNFAKYSSIAFQMLVTIGLFCFIGYKIDEYRSDSKHLFAALFGLVGVVISLYQVIRALNKTK